MPCKVYSSGGSGTNFLQRFLINCGIDMLKDQNPHLLYPPRILKRSAKVIYMFANPMNMISAFFKYNEESKYKQISDKSYSWASNGEIYSWAYKHCRDVSGNYEKLDINCNLEKFLAEGQDHFLLEEHFDNWVQAERNYPILYIRYEELSRYIGQILQFVGVDLELLSKFKFKARKTDWTKQPQDIQDGLWRMFGNLYEKIQVFPSFLVKEAVNY